MHFQQGELERSLEQLEELQAGKQGDPEGPQGMDRADRGPSIALAAAEARSRSPWEGAVTMSWE